MNEAQFLLSLGMKPKPRPEGLASPALVDLNHRYSEGSAMIETREETNAFIDSNKSLADRTLPQGRPGAAHI